ncbi:MAG: RNA methyltransferase, partial [Bryobacteraceae bacterium]|nr:RNA methyltransferase [Bryobacteraceae bacterium]
MSLICGVNPVREALRAGRGMDRILIAQGAGGARLQEIIDLAREQKVPVRFEAKQFIERTAAGQAHQGVLAYVSPQKYQRFEDLEQPELVLVLDGVEDPHNLGAILRTADAVGAGGVIIPERRAAGLSETVAKMDLRPVASLLSYRLLMMVT